MQAEHEAAFRAASIASAGQLNELEGLLADERNSKAAAELRLERSLNQKDQAQTVEAMTPTSDVCAT
jgi:hypothetical protein